MPHILCTLRRPAILVALALFLVLTPLPAGSAGHAQRAVPAAPAVPGEPAAQAAPAQDGILGATLRVVADGSAPWENRPLPLPGLGEIPGDPARMDPGDDVQGPNGVVRSWDSLQLQLAISVRSGPAEDLVAEVQLGGPLSWERGQLEALRLSACPEGVQLEDEGRRLLCRAGRIEAPPARTLALDLSARVEGSALNGERITAAARVVSPSVAPERERTRCPRPLEQGCADEIPEIRVSAAPAAELRKHFLEAVPYQKDGVMGRALSWRLDVILGADGDVRGTSEPVGAPWTLPDWWRLTSRGGRALELPVELLGCRDLDEGADWACAQPGGPGQPLEVTLASLDLAAVRPRSVRSSLPELVGSLETRLWLPEAELRAAGSDVWLMNCFGTEIGAPNVALWGPADAGGVPNLGGADEPVHDNCAEALLRIPRPGGGGGGGGGRGTPAPPPEDPRRPRPGPPPPEALVFKRYTPVGQGAGVTEGREIQAEVALRVQAPAGLASVALCDKWDNRTQALIDAGRAGVEVYWQAPGGEPQLMDEAAFAVDYARGPWGRRPDGAALGAQEIGERWYAQSVAACDDAGVAAPGWVGAREVDFGDAGGAALDARDVNAVRVRILEPLAPELVVWMEVDLRVLRNPANAWLMNYGAAGWGEGRRRWELGECDGARGSGARRACPVPPPGMRGRPGRLGDMLVHVGVPLWLRKTNDPEIPDGSPIVLAGETAGFALEVSSMPRPGAPPLPPFPPGAHALAVVVTDTLPAGLSYEAGSATLDSEDLDGDGRLGPGEDRNGNGRLDRDLPFEPEVVPPDVPGGAPGAAEGRTELRWALGDLPFGVRVPALRFRARVSRLVPSGSTLVNVAGVRGRGDPPLRCAGARPNDDPVPFAPDLQPTEPVPDPLCAWAQVIVRNAAAAQVEKRAPRPWAAPGEDFVYRLGLANLSGRAAEWFDAVDLLPRAGEPRSPESRITGGHASVRARDLSGGFDLAPVEVWASATDPERLDAAGGGVRDGLVDPVQAWGAEGAGLGGPDWPCPLEDVGGFRCAAIPDAAAVTALRFWGPDPRRGHTGGAADSFLPADGPARWLEIVLEAPGSRPGDLAHNAWGGRFEGLPLPVFDDAIVAVPPASTATPSPTRTPTPSPPASATATPSATGTPPRATGTPSATPSPSPSSTATAPGPARHRVYLPVSLRLPCAPRPVDVVLVIDASTSMLRSAGDGGTKLDAVTRASRAFLDDFLASSGENRVALLAFNDRATLLQARTGRRALLDRALDELPGEIREGTRLDLGLRAGASALQGGGEGRWKAMVLLTDGLPNRVPTPEGGGRQEDTVLAAAADAAAAGVTIHTVGYGRPDAPDLADRISPELLRAIAGDPERYHETDDAGGLAALFLELAGQVGCGRERGWP